MLEPKRMKGIIDDVEPKDFHHKQHQDIFTAMAYLHYQNMNIDYSLIIERLKTKDKASEEIVEYILELTDVVTSTVNFDHKISTLKDYSSKRKLYDIGKWIIESEISGISSDNIKNKIESELEELSVTSNIESSDIKENVDEWYSNLMDPTPAGSMIFGMRKLDEHIILKPKNLGIIAARPSLGKSAYALYLAVNFAKQNKRVFFASLEMSWGEVLNRVAARFARVKYGNIESKSLSKEDTEKITEAVDDLKKLPIEIYDKGQMNVDHLYNFAKKKKKENDIDVVVVDYIQLLESGQNKKSENENVSYISRKLKLIAQELDVPVIALSQLSRASEQNVGGKKSVREPQLSDMRASGSLEQDANYVIMLHTDDTENVFNKQKFIKAFIRKNRSGTLGSIDLTYYGDYMTFEEKEWVDGKPVAVEQLELDEYTSELGDMERPF